MAHLSQEEQLKLITDLEIEMMADMYNRYGSGYQAMQSKIPEPLQVPQVLRLYYRTGVD